MCTVAEEQILLGGRISLQTKEDNKFGRRLGKFREEKIYKGIHNRGANFLCKIAPQNSIYLV
jgi:hypothetical protein